MTGSAIPLEEFDYEMGATRRLLERVPSEHGRWKPHEKSFALGHLTHLRLLDVPLPPIYGPTADEPG